MPPDVLFPIPDSEHQEVFPYQNDVKVTLTYETRNGIDIPWPTKATITTPDNEVNLVGKNLGAISAIIADALSKNPIAD